ncbi:hypothetical protein D3C72_812390 [compost metagenome]
MLGRLRQVWYYLTPRLTDADRAWVGTCLNPAQQALFDGMGLQDRAHAVRVARRLAAQDAPGHVLEAALLHDCAKPEGYGLFWRSAGVLLAPALQGLPAEPALPGWKRWLQVYRWHDAYGMALAELAGTSPEALALLRALQDDAPHGEGAPAWLEPLERADDGG